MTEFFVSRMCIAYPPEGSELSARIGVFTPVATGRNGWQCKLILEGISDEEKSAFGVDQWHSLQMGMQMVWFEVRLKAATGWRFAWSNGESMELEEFLPPWGREVAPKIFDRF